MANEIRLKTPLTEEDVDRLKIGDKVLISGVIYTGRDAAHKRMIDLLNQGKELPVDVRGQVIYYVGPAPARPGKPIGSAGPTTSYRMDAYAPRLMEIGMRGMIGKGNRAPEVIQAMKKNRRFTLGPPAAPGRCSQRASKRRKWLRMKTSGPRPSIDWK